MSRVRQSSKLCLCGCSVWRGRTDPFSWTFPALEIILLLNLASVVILSAKMKVNHFNAGCLFFSSVWLMLPQPVFSFKEETNKITLVAENCVTLKWLASLSLGAYDKHQAPRVLPLKNIGTPEPVKVFVSGVVQIIAPIVASETEFSVIIKFILKWNDTRLSREGMCNTTNSEVIILSDEVTKFIWLPNLYIVNAKYAAIKKFKRKLISVTLSSKGAVTMSLVVNATVDCAMNFRWYPMDSQVCPMNIECFSYDSAYLEYNWIPNEPFLVIPRRLLQFDVEPVLEYTKSLSFNKHLERNFTRLTASFKFNRIWSNHFIQTVVPCTLIVSLSWFSFWLELDATSARGSLLATAMLTLVTQFLSLRTTLPPVAYVKALDVWMLGCMLTIFAAVAEFALVKTLYSITEELLEQNRVQIISTLSFISGDRCSNSNNDYQLFYYKNLDDHLNKVLDPSRRKARLGSCVLSGRSIATNDLPSYLEWSLFFDSIRIPLIWSTKPKPKNYANLSNEPQDDCMKMLLWRQVDVVSKIIFPVLFLLFSVAHWIVLVVFSRHL